MEIYGFNHDDLTSGGKAPYTFGMKNLMANTRVINNSWTNEGSFTGSNMYSYLVNNVFANFPSDVKSVAKSVKKKTSAGGGSRSVLTESMNIFLFSNIEIDGYDSTNWSSNEEGSRYPIFTDYASEIKRLSNGSGAAYEWWTRSPHVRNDDSWFFVYDTGSTDFQQTDEKYGVCFGFCV